MVISALLNVNSSQSKIFFKNLKPWWRWIRLLAALVAVVLLVRVVLENGRQVQDILAHVRILPLLAAVLLSGCSFFLSSLSWRALLAAQGARLNAREAWWSSTHSLLIRYLPGGLPGVYARVNVMQRYGLPLTHGGWNVVIEMGLGIWTALLLFFAGGWFGRIPLWVGWLVIIGVFVGIVGLIFLGTKQPLLVRWRQHLRMPSLTYRAMIPMAWWFILTWLAYGWAHWWLLRSIGLSGAVGFFPLTGAFGFAWVTGVLAVIVPSGIGVREGAMIFLLQPAIGSAAVTVALLSRLALTVGELINVVAAWLGRPTKESKVPTPTVVP